MIQINYKFSYGAICLTTEWEKKKKDFFEFCMKNSSRFRDDRVFARHMYKQYVDTDIPITLQAYNLDAENLRLLLLYIEKLTSDIADLYIEVPQHHNITTMDRNLNIVNEFPNPAIVDDGDHTIIWARLRDFDGDIGIRFRKPWGSYGQMYDGIVMTPDCALQRIGADNVIDMICERLCDFAEKTFGRQRNQESQHELEKQ